MKKLITVAVILILVACKSETKKETTSTIQNETEKTSNIITQSTSSSNYSSLFDSYTCDISSADLAKVLQIPASNITLDNNTKPSQCRFRLKGFGKGYENEGTILFFRPRPSTKNQNKKVITEFLKEKAEMPNGKMHAGRDFLLADAGDCYILIESLIGRLSIINENYKHLFSISFGNQASIIGRTKEQHVELTKKALDLANFLVKTHKK